MRYKWVLHPGAPIRLYSDSYNYIISIWSDKDVFVESDNNISTLFFLIACRFLISENHTIICIDNKKQEVMDYFDLCLTGLLL